jgi:hypothetical protein
VHINLVELGISLARWCPKSIVICQSELNFSIGWRFRMPRMYSGLFLSKTGVQDQDVAVIRSVVEVLRLWGVCQTDSRCIPADPSS